MLSRRDCLKMYVVIVWPFTTVKNTSDLRCDWTACKNFFFPFSNIIRPMLLCSCFKIMHLSPGLLCLMVKACQFSDILLKLVIFLICLGRGFTRDRFEKLNFYYCRITERVVCFVELWNLLLNIIWTCLTCCKIPLSF